MDGNVDCVCDCCAQGNVGYIAEVIRNFVPFEGPLSIVIGYFEQTALDRWIHNIVLRFLSDPGATITDHEFNEFPLPGAKCRILNTYYSCIVQTLTDFEYEHARVYPTDGGILYWATFSKQLRRYFPRLQTLIIQQDFGGEHNDLINFLSRHKLKVFALFDRQSHSVVTDTDELLSVMPDDSYYIIECTDTVNTHPEIEGGGVDSIGQHNYILELGRKLIFLRKITETEGRVKVFKFKSGERPKLVCQHKEKKDKDGFKVSSRAP